jgi:hydroxymethylglutaryl-CoA reductase
MINIENISEVENYLNFLTIKHKPMFGKLDPQQMMEHLSMTLKMSNGKEKHSQFTSEERLEGYRRFLMSDKEMPIGTKVPFMGEEPPLYVNGSFEEAKTELFNELKAFQSHFNMNPVAIEMHPVFGNLNKQEWLRLHGKHFLHHFKQFGLIG